MTFVLVVINFGIIMGLALSIMYLWLREYAIKRPGSRVHRCMTAACGRRVHRYLGKLRRDDELIEEVVKEVAQKKAMKRAANAAGSEISPAGSAPHPAGSPTAMSINNPMLHTGRAVVQ